jgi:hypothetical protein
MKLYERLTQLVGHQIFVINTIPGEDEGIPGGALQEAGEDYLIVKTSGSSGEDECSHDDCGHAQIGAEWIVTLATVANIIHGDNCQKCMSDARKAIKAKKLPKKSTR